MLADSLGGYEAAIGATADIVCNPFSERVVIRRRPSAVDLEPGMRVADRLGAGQFHEPIMPIESGPAASGTSPRRNSPAATALEKRLLGGGQRLNVPSAEPVTARQRSQQLVRLDSSLLVFALALEDELRHVLMLS